MRPAPALARAWLPRLFIIALTWALIAYGPNVLDLPIPDGAVAFDKAELHLDDRPPTTVSLPHRWPRDIGRGPVEARYVFSLPAGMGADEPQALLIPTARLGMTAHLNGHLLDRNTPRPTGEASGFSVMMRLPQLETSGDPAQLVITLEREAGIMSGYLSPIHVVPERQLSRDRWRWAMGDGVIRTVALAVHVLMVFAVAFLWFARRRDPIFGWLFFLAAASLFNVLLGSAMAPPWLAWAQPYIVLLASGLGVAMTGLAMAIIGRARPAWLRAGVVAVPAALCAAAAADVAPFPLLLGTAVLIAAAGNIIGGLLLLGAGTRPTDWNRLFLAVPFFLTGCFSLRDIAVVLGLLDGAFLLTSYVRTLTIVAVLALLMRRLVTTLTALDKANEIQRLMLLEQGDELSRLHQREQTRMVQRTREEERQRLMRDLHDGLSGYLVSIIALSERGDTDPKAVENTAREALEDLRLVINSLDLEDGGLRPALAGFRERLGPRLRRLGVELDWSMEDLPQVRGITPANALSILRILQEAVTNAIKHGPARRIEIRGATDGDDRAVVTVRNDVDTGAAAGAPGQGHGLGNMHRRARELGGFVLLDHAPGHALLTLNLPTDLTEA